MGTKYSSQSTSGYNATPPADDGSEVSSNQIFWSTIKTKLSDVLKTFAEAINSTVLTALDQSVLNTSQARTTIAGDHIRTINVTAAATQSLGDAATMATGYIVTIKNSHTAAITVDLATGTDTLNGTVAGSYSLQAGEERTFRVNSTADGYLSSASNGVFAGNVTVGGDILDANGNEILELTETASAINHLSATNAIISNGPTLSAVGDDTDIDLNLVGKGTGVVKANGIDLTISGLIDVQTFTASGTWTKPAGCTAVEVQVVGAGGGGGGCATASSGNTSLGGSGGGGGYTFEYINAGLGATETVTVGAGGTGGTAGANAGSAGTASSFGAFTSANGGAGGSGGADTAASSPYILDNGGVGGAVDASGDFGAPGMKGGLSISLSASQAYSGPGGFCGMGIPANENAFTIPAGTGTTGITATGIGGGGSGGACEQSDTQKAGGDGADGLVIVRAYK